VSAQIITLETPSLGDRSYVVTDGTVAVVIDPQRDIDRVLAAAGEARITHVLETHMHNDYVSGGLELAQRTGAAYVVAAGEEVAFEHQAASDGDVITSGSINLRVLHTPGHTLHHLAYVLLEDGQPAAAFTGGSLLYGAVGRPDLISAELTPRLARDQHRSARRLADLLPDSADVLPTHGFGSHCASVTDDIMRSGTMGEELARNPALTLDEDAFVEQLLGGLHPYPAYYAHMGPLNVAGPPTLDLSPPALLDADRLREHIAAGDWVVDLRQRRAFAHLSRMDHPLGCRLGAPRRRRSGHRRGTADARAHRAGPTRRSRDRRTGPLG
jgi:glyoxylase-like metal-dependent hydrolase (beta-lactamase superfamily II)